VVILPEIEHYGDLVFHLKKIGCKIIHFRKNIILHNFERGYELEVDREFFPKKASVEQLNWLYEQAVEMNSTHPVVNKRFRW